MRDFLLTWLMSKAFVRESDLPDLPERTLPNLLPAGAKNYLTPEGARLLRSELVRLMETERPRLIAMGADKEAKNELQTLDQRIRYLEQSLRTAEVVEQPNLPTDEVHFGATVTVRDPSGETASYRIVGVDEANPECGYISWLSPIARALLSAKAGQRVLIKAPGGERPLDLIAVTYD